MVVVTVGMHTCGLCTLSNAHAGCHPAREQLSCKAYKVVSVLCELGGSHLRLAPRTSLERQPVQRVPRGKSVNEVIGGAIPVPATSRDTGSTKQTTLYNLRRQPRRYQKARGSPDHADPSVAAHLLQVKRACKERSIEGVSSAERPGQHTQIEGGAPYQNDQYR